MDKVSVNNSLRLSKDNFYKKVQSSKGFGTQQQNKGEIYSTLIQTLKSDLLQIQEMINSNTPDIAMFKILSKTPGLSKKITEIEEGQQTMKPTIEKISESSKNVEKIGKSYGCNNASDLIQKMNLELSYNELLLKKFKELFIIMKLKLCNDDTYQDTMSKILDIKIFFEKIGNILNKGASSESKPSLPSLNKPKPLASKMESKNDLEVEEFLKTKSVNEIIEFKDSPNKLFIHFSKLINNFLNAINGANSSLLFKNVNDPSIKSQIRGSEIDQFYAIRGFLEKLIDNLNSKVKSLENNQNTNIISAKEDEDSNEKELFALKQRYENIIKKQEEENSKLKIENQSLIEKLELLRKELENKTTSTELSTNYKYTEKDINDLKQKNEKEIQEMKKIIDQHKKTIENLNATIKAKDLEINELKDKSKNPSVPVPSEFKIDVKKLIKDHDQNLKNMQRENASRLNEEYKNLKTKYEVLNNSYEALKKDNENLNKRLGVINKKFDPESYEQVLLEQFNTMKNSFMQKVDDLTYQLEESKNKHFSEVYQLKQELEEANHLKDVFLKQVMNLQKD